MICLAPRVPGEILGPRRLSGVVVRPLNFTVRAHVNAVVLSNVVRVLFIIAFVAMIGARQYYTRHMPTTPQPLEQRVVPVSVNYGQTVYVTPGERDCLYAAYASCALTLGAIAFLYVRSNNRWRGP